MDDISELGLFNYNNLYIFDSHFWSPSMKWALVIAGIGDLQRPADKLSPTQSSGTPKLIHEMVYPDTDISIALAATGVIWSRYSTQITPVNYNLLLVNVFVAATGLFQLYRIYDYRQKLDPHTSSTTTTATK